MLRAALYALALSLLANVGLYALWQHAAGENARNEARAAKAEIKAMRDLAAARDEASRQLALVRSRMPKAGRKVSDAAHANPSNCTVDPAVVDSLSRAIDEGNAARRAAGSLP